MIKQHTELHSVINRLYPVGLPHGKDRSTEECERLESRHYALVSVGFQGKIRIKNKLTRGFGMYCRLSEIPPTPVGIDATGFTVWSAVQHLLYLFARNNYAVDQVNEIGTALIPNQIIWSVYFAHRNFNMWFYSLPDPTSLHSG